jgi:hypothetical protein
MDEPYLTRQEWREAAASDVATSRGTTAEYDHAAQTADVALDRLPCKVGKVRQANNLSPASGLFNFLF